MKETLSLIYFGQKNKDFDYKDFDLIKKLKRLYLKHHRQCENDCNGSGYVKGQMYYTGTIDDYARRKYGLNVKSGYDNDYENVLTVFYAEINKLECKMLSLITVNSASRYNERKYHPYKLEFQHDPRGLTVKLYYNGNLIDWSLF